ncbi:hypothetical protein Hanom_Chr00s124979g01813111 [Helianthus anomalus]
MMEDEEEDGRVDESETEIETMDEGLTTETIHVSPPHVESISATADGRSLEEPTADLQPRKRSRRDPRLSGEVNIQATSDTSNPTDTSLSHPQNPPAEYHRLGA